MMLALYGHPFSSYTWKAQIALLGSGLEHELRIVDGDHPDHGKIVAMAGPQGKFPVLQDGGNLIFEATSIIEYLQLHHVEPDVLLPSDADAAIGVRMLDRVFDNYVMSNMQDVVNEYIRDAQNPDMGRISEARERLERSYAWLEGWLQYYPSQGQVTLIECAAAPSLFYADWVHPIAETFPRLRDWRAHLLALPPVSACIEAARPYRAFFPLGAPDRD
ncbi:glutathione S-transferase [Novosphingobium guangzhouense]|uniref:Glutathione S-transferase n=2 Tax=Novosphingobium guangzhouense TaxID=1850347 RepID=A0A2K2G1Q8_9SPHN|nr:glutathione S-transferase [Novosphingobium guangzhouense]